MDDSEVEISKAPSMNQIRQLADVIILNYPISEKDKPIFNEARIILALRERIGGII